MIITACYVNGERHTRLIVTGAGTTGAAVFKLSRRL
jgi:hypothetical protein